MISSAVWAAPHHHSFAQRIVGIHPRRGITDVAALLEGVNGDQPAGKILELLAQLRYVALGAQPQSAVLGTGVEAPPQGSHVT